MNNKMKEALKLSGKLTIQWFVGITVINLVLAAYIYVLGFGIDAIKYLFFLTYSSSIAATLLSSFIICFPFMKKEE